MSEIVPANQLVNGFIDNHLELIKCNAKINDLQEPKRPETFATIAKYESYKTLLSEYISNRESLHSQKKDLIDRIRVQESEIFNTFRDAGRFLQHPLSDVNAFIPLEREDGIKLLEEITPAPITSSLGPKQYVIRNNRGLDYQFRWRLVPTDEIGIKLKDLERID